MIALADIKVRLQQLIDQADTLVGTKYIATVNHNHPNQEFVDDESYRLFRAVSLSFLVSAFGREHTFYEEFNKMVHGNYLFCAKTGRAILNAAKQELDGGWIFATKDVVSGEIFTDFLEMAEYLLSKNYFQPAAVLTGSVLEQHLRHLCTKNGIPISVNKDGKDVPNKAETMNTDLAKQNVYGKSDQKQVTAWLGIRNHAAHGEHTLYTKEQVVLMEQGVTNFLARTV
jgi:hypothetical protein